MQIKLKTNKDNLLLSMNETQNEHELNKQS
jgi:hypothetical protein